MSEQKHIPTWDELMESINSVGEHPLDTGWSIYRYLNANYKTLGSKESRSLLAIYMKIPQALPSLLHSCMLNVSVKMSELYPDFNFAAFLQMCHYPQNLRPEDMEKQKGSDGRTYSSLKEKIEKALASYKLHNPESRTEEDETIVSMYAVKLFETERDGRKLRSVKLVASDGMELLADSHLFSCKPWEIVGKLYDVLIRTSKEGNRRASEIVVSNKKMSDVFETVVGYVDRYDAANGQYHIFDNQSRHFVAEKPVIKPIVGSFVNFAPIIPNQDKFKSAYIYNNVDEAKGLESFGTYDAVVKYVNEEKGYFYYQLLKMPAETPEGEYTNEGSAQLSLVNVNGGSNLKVGMNIQIMLFLARGSDKKKHNRVVKIIV